MSGLQERAESEVVRAAVERALARPEFGSEPTWIERLAEALAELAGTLGLEGGPLDSRVLVVVAVVLGVLTGLVLGRLAARSASRRPGAASTPAGRRARAAALLAEAERARAAGDLRTALRLTWTALVVGLGERGHLDYRDAWTNRELLARGAVDGGVARELEPLLASIEAQEFGRAPVDSGTLERVRAACRARGLVAGGSA